MRQPTPTYLGIGYRSRRNERRCSLFTPPVKPSLITREQVPYAQEGLVTLYNQPWASRHRVPEYLPQEIQSHSLGLYVRSARDCISYGATYSRPSNYTTHQLGQDAISLAMLAPLAAPWFPRGGDRPVQVRSQTVTTPSFFSSVLFHMLAFKRTLLAERAA